MNKKEFFGLNWLRFYLSVYLVLYHTLKNTYKEIDNKSFLYSIFDIGNMATTIFFVLSGFLLTYTYIYGKNHAPLNKRNFLVGRLSALYPLHLLTLLPYLSLALISIYEIGGLQVVTNVFSGEIKLLNLQQSVLAILQNITLLHSWNPSYMIFNPPSWSISTLLFFYLAFPFFAPLITKVSSPFIGLLGLSILFAIPGIIADFFHMTDMTTLGILHRNPLIRLPLFLAGIFLCVAYIRQKNELIFNNKKYNLILDSIVIITVFISAYAKYSTSEYELHFINNGLYFPASIAIIWRMANLSFTPSIWSKKWSSRLGKASLCIFIFHYPLFSLLLKFEKLISSIYANISGAENLGPVLSAVPDYHFNIYLYPFYFSIIIASSVIFQEKFVSPMQSFIKRKLSSTVSIEKKLILG